MLDVFNTPNPQTANYQEFYSNGTWIKPRGASMVRFLLIGAGGGGGNGGTTQGNGGGGAGAITSWIGPAIFIPDILRITVGVGGVASVNATASTVIYQTSNSTSTLLSANGGNSNNSTTAGATGATAMQPNQFTAAGIFKAINAQGGTAGSATGAGSSVSAPTIFLTGGAGGSGGSGNVGGGVGINFGYPSLSTTPAGGTVKGKDGYFMTSPLMNGCGGAGGSTNTTGTGSNGGNGGIGCGGGGAGEDALTGGGRGGNGAVFVWAW